VIGSGSMGVVFEAEHQKLGRHVALKVLPPGLGNTQRAIQRFLREAQAVAQLDHENIVRIFGIGQEGSTHYYAMQLLDGEPLDKRMARERISYAEAAKLVCTASRAVNFAHQRGIIHRDIKPANMILCADGKLMLTDFGLARPEHGASLTDSGAMVGTPLYMSPEQIRGRRGEVDRSTDVYSLGATLYEMLAGAPPFHGQSTQEILQEILEVEPPPPRTLNRSIPGELEVITLKALEKNPKRRYKSALALGQDLERFLEGEPILARRTGVVTRVMKRVRKHRTISALSCVIVLLLLGVFASVWMVNRAGRQTAFDNALREGDRQFTRGLYSSSRLSYLQALEFDKKDPRALLGHSRALYRASELWDSRRKEHNENPDELMRREFASPRAAFELALRQVEEVIAQRPEEPLPYLCRGNILLDLGDPSLRQNAINDILRAERLCEQIDGGGSWETMALISDLHLDIVADQEERPDRCNELLQRALTNSSLTLEKCRRQRQQRRAFDESLNQMSARLLAQRAKIYQSLFDLTRNLELYMEVCLADAEQALALVPDDPRATDCRRVASAYLKEGNNPSALDLARIGPSIISWMTASDQQQQAKALAELLSVGGEALFSGWRQTEQFRAEMMEAVIGTFDAAAGISEDDRATARAAALEARDYIQETYRGHDVDHSSWQSAKAQLIWALEHNPYQAQYHHELSFVCRELYVIIGSRDDLDRAIRAATDARRLSPYNAVFLAQEAELRLFAAQQPFPYPDRQVHHREAKRQAQRVTDLYPTVVRLQQLLTDIQELDLQQAGDA
jgi:serine/threonine protein kinase